MPAHRSDLKGALDQFLAYDFREIDVVFALLLKNVGEDFALERIRLNALNRSGENPGEHGEIVLTASGIGDALLKG